MRNSLWDTWTTTVPFKWLIPRPGLVQTPFHKGHLKRINDLLSHASQLRSMKIPREILPKKDRYLSWWGTPPDFSEKTSLLLPLSDPWEHTTNCENHERLGLKMSSCYYHWILHLSIRSWPSAVTVWIPQDLETKLAVRRLNHDWTTGVVSSS